jgi:hypothetical protein
MPGKHSIETRMNASASIEIDVLAGTKQTVRIGFAAPSAASPADASPATVQPAPAPSPVASSAGAEAAVPAVSPDTGHAHPSFWTTRRAIGVAVAGVGVVSFVLSGVFQAQSSSDQNHASSLRSQLGPSDCNGPNPKSQCSALSDAYSAQDRDLTLSRVFLGAGIGGVLVGGALFFWPQPAPAAHAAVVEPFALPHGGGLRIQGDL